MGYLAKRLRLCCALRAAYASVVLADQPYAYWRLNEPSGTVAADSSGHLRTGAYQAGAQLASAALLPATSERYVTLTGAANSFVDVSAARQFCASGAWSIECWASITSYNNPAGANGAYPDCTGIRFLGNTTWKGGGSTAPGLDWGISYHNSGNINRNLWLWLDSYRQAATNAGTAPPESTTHHFVLTATADQWYAFYLDGAQLARAKINGAATIQTTLQIGTLGWTLGAMNGPIGEFALYDKTLSASQIYAHYIAGAGA